MKTWCDIVRDVVVWRMGFFRGEEARAVRAFTLLLG